MPRPSQAPVAACLPACSQDTSAVKESSVLYSWLAQRLVTYLAALRLHLPAVSEGANLASVLEHCLYCASSLARVGMDFSGLLQPVSGPCWAIRCSPPRAIVWYSASLSCCLGRVRQLPPAIVLHLNAGG